MKKLLSICLLSGLVLLFSCTKSNNVDNTSSSVPGSPVVLTGSVAPNFQINLKWTDSSSNESGFHVERKSGSGAYSVIGSVGPNVTTYLDATTVANTTYTYRVNAFNNAGNSINYTNEVTLNPSNASDSLTVILSRDTVENNGWDMVAIRVINAQGTDVTSSSTLYLNSGVYSNALSSSTYYPSAVGSYTISATKSTTTSNKAPLTVKTTSASAFTHKIIVEDYTSIYCGFCPRETYALDNYSKTHPKCAWVAVHCTGLGPDKYAFRYSSNMESTYGISGYPSTIVNRRANWQEDTTSLNSETAKWTGVGLSLNSTLSGTTISGTASVKFNFTTNKPLKIVVAIVESGLLASQDNYYSPSGGYTPYLYNGQNPILNFDEKFCLRTTSTDVFGDSIPVSATTKSNVYSLPFSFSTSGVNANGAAYTLNPANCRIIAYVLDGSTAKWSSSKGVLNVQYATVGATQPFD